MKRTIINGKLCIGPSFSNAEFKLMKDEIKEQAGLKTLAGLLEVVGNQKRLEIVYLLHKYKKMCVCDLAEILGVSVSALSQHLRKLKDKNLVITDKKAQTIFYSLRESVFTSKLEKLFLMEERKEEFAYYK